MKNLCNSLLGLLFMGCMASDPISPPMIGRSIPLGHYLGHYDGTTISPEARDSVLFQFDQGSVMVNKKDMQDALNNGFDFPGMTSGKNIRALIEPVTEVYIEGSSAIMLCGPLYLNDPRPSGSP